MALWHQLEEDGLVNGQLFTSLHIGHELVPNDKSVAATVCSPNAITGADLEAMILAETVAPINALTHPCFNYGSTTWGGILHPDPNVREVAYRGHCEAILRSLALKQKSLGLGRAIWWPAGDGGFMPGLHDSDLVVSNDLIPQSKKWVQMVEFWVKVLRETGGTVHLEAKMGDPVIDLICTPQLAIRFCQEINRQLNRVAMFLNWEFAHTLGMGEFIDTCMQMTIDAGLFDGMFHGNSGQMLPVRIHDLLQTPDHPLNKIPVMMDWDLAVGMGSPDVIADQWAAFRLMRQWAETTSGQVLCEHDVHPFQMSWKDCLTFSATRAQIFWNDQS
jgi:hypothetical protein